MDSQSAIPRPSGIPRPASSRLPVLRPSGSQSQLRAPASTEQLRKKPSISSISRPNPQTATLQKKASRASLIRSNTPSTASSATSGPTRASLTSSSRRASGIPSFGQPRASTSIPTNDAPVFKKPFARPPSRQTKAPPQPASASNISREDDAVGSLDGFRSASRASSRASSRAGFHEHAPEPDHVLEDEPEFERGSTQRSQPSLSERTVESLAHLPPSPAPRKGRRRSSFFNADNSMPPPPRPASAMSNNSRPTTSDGPTYAPPATPKRLLAPSGRMSMTAPGKRSASANVITPTATPSRQLSTSRPVSTIKKLPLSQAQNLVNTPKPRPLFSSKSMVTRTPKARPSLAGTFGQAISPTGPAVAAPITPPSRNNLTTKTPDTSRKVSSSSTVLRDQIAKAKAARKVDAGVTPTESPPKAASSSNALREQIAKAKAAARQGKVEPVRTSTPPRDAIIPDPVEIASFDFGLDDDPFNQRGKSGKSLLRKRIDGARVDGRLNIAAMGLKEIPDEVLAMYKYDPEDKTVAWGEIVDLDVIVVADNELEALPVAMFPDVDIEDLIDSDEAGPQFGGVQSLDLHGNVLRELPMGLRRLTQLSKLNLSRNKLPMEILEVIAHIPTLRELKLAENDLQGDLSTALCNLGALEVLELQGNKLSSLPAAMGQLSLRTLNVSDNQLKTIPAELFTSSLIELHASKNRLDGALFSVDSVPHLQVLHVANNSLVSLCGGNSIHLSSLRILNLSTNRLISLPEVTNWTSLTTLLVSENKLDTLPEGFVTLPIRTADFTSNDITQLDERIALMENLEHLTFAANPLRERKFLTMGTEEIKRDLASRLQASDATTADQDGDVESDTTELAQGTMWKLTPSGTLDLSGKSLTELDLDEASLDAFTDNLRQLQLQENILKAIPAMLSHLAHLTVLDLSKNNIEVALTAPLELLKLRELRLASNKIKSLEPLTAHLTAPSLHTLDISHNRLTGALTLLQPSFPALVTLLASDNSISEVSAESLTGLKVVNLSNNDIERLEPRIGLLQGILTALEVAGNRFRVPNYQILGKGTDAVLTWLRDRIPRESWKSDGTEAEFFDADDGTSF
ncbi:L domain-like protein [Cucurbitaria berberidis CBS 394.84]|uniref:L domain-like protein n=1 Tax=Cucurbitaria berberidis CBS 394.84 TaxID=1168544 RepID=A0A9P4GAX4_9PLEO|nr:L domain-like protein [Cucurbitaria berberidis CBS 394.84]KAF1842206.1 L domain-like protein [Cucurbitaria berberidis CBS 394.84]